MAELDESERAALAVLMAAGACGVADVDTWVLIDVGRTTDNPSQSWVKVRNRDTSDEAMDASYGRLGRV